MVRQLVASVTAGVSAWVDACALILPAPRPGHTLLAAELAAD